DPSLHPQRDGPGHFLRARRPFSGPALAGAEDDAGTTGSHCRPYYRLLPGLPAPGAGSRNRQRRAAASSQNRGQENSQMKEPETVDTNRENREQPSPAKDAPSENPPLPGAGPPRPGRPGAGPPGSRRKIIAALAVV